MGLFGNGSCCWIIILILLCTCCGGNDCGIGGIGNNCGPCNNCACNNCGC